MSVLGQKKYMWVSRPFLAFGPQNPDPKLFYWITLAQNKKVQNKKVPVPSYSCDACKCFHLEENVCGK